MNAENGKLYFGTDLDTSGFEKGVSTLKKSIAGIAGAFSAEQLIKKVIEVRGEFQKLEISFKTMLNSEVQATKLMQQLTKTAATTPFDLQSVAQGAKQLLAYGDNVENVNDDLIRLGNIAAGLSQPLGDIVYLYGTTMTQGRLYTRDLNQFTGRGIPMIRELAEQFGVAESEVLGLVEAGKVGFPEVQKVIQKMTNEGGMFYNLMQEQSKSLPGQISNLGDSIDMMFNEIGKSSQDFISDGISIVQSLVDNYEKVGRVLIALAGSYGVYKAAVIAATLVEKVRYQASLAHMAGLTKMQAVMDALKAKTLALNAAMMANPYVLLGVAVAGLATAFALAETKEEKLQKASEKYNDELQKQTDLHKKHVQEVNRLISVADDESLSTDTRREALVALEKQYPLIFAKYDTEYEKLKNIANIKKEIAQYENQNSIENPKNQMAKIDEQLDAYGQKLEELEKKKQDAYSMSGGNYYTVGAVQNMYDPQIKEIKLQMEMLNKERDKLEETINKGITDDYFSDLKEKSDEEIQYMLNQRKNLLAKMHVQGASKGKIINGDKEQQGSFSEKEIQAQINWLNDEVNKRTATRGSSKDWAKEAIAKYNEAQKAYDDFLKASNNNLTQAEFEKRANELKEIRDAAKKEADKFRSAATDTSASEERLEAEKKIAQELTDLQSENTTERLSQMKEGQDKELKLLHQEYMAKEREINDLAQQWEEANKKIGRNSLTSEQKTALDNAHKLNESAYTAESNRIINKYVEEEKRTMNDFLKEYGTDYEKKLAITEEYEQKIAEARTEGEKLLLEKQRDQAISTLNADTIKDAIHWDQVFGNLGENSLESLQFTKIKLASFIDTSEGLGIDVVKDLEDAMATLDEEINARNPFIAFHQSIKDITEAKTEFVEAGKELTSATEEVTLAQQEYNTAISEQSAIQEEINANGATPESEERLAAAKENALQAQNKLNQAQKRQNQAEGRVLQARNGITKSYRNFATELRRVSGLVVGVGHNAKNLAAVFSQDVADGIGKALDVIDATVEGVGGVIDAVSDTTSSVTDTIAQTAQASSTAIQGTSAAATTSIKAMESASVILAVISAALQIATAIANALSGKAAKEAYLEDINNQIEELQFNLDNIAAFNVEEQTFNAANKVKDIYTQVAEQVLGVKKLYEEVWTFGGWAVRYLSDDEVFGSKFQMKLIKSGKETEILQKATERLTDEYLKCGYVIEEALGEDRFNQYARNIENLAQQQILIQKQIEAEKEEKDPDEAKIREWEQKQLDAQKEVAENSREMVESIFGQSYADVASSFGDALIDAFRNGEDAAEAWGNKTKDIISDIVKNMLVAEVLEKPIKSIFDRYQRVWYDGEGKFKGFDMVTQSLPQLSEDLNGIVYQAENWMNELPEDIKAMVFGENAEEREGTQGGIATASQDSVDENNARLTAIQEHTYNIAETTLTISQAVSEINRTGNAVLERLTSIDDNTADTAERVRGVEESVVKISKTMDDIAIKGVKMI